MRSVTNLREQLLLDEGLRLQSYKDSLGFLTIGVGRLIDPKKGGGISKDEAMLLLDNDIKAKTKQLQTALPWMLKLCEARQGVLLNMAFQMGVEGLLKFKNTLAMIQAGKYEAAADGMLQSLWAKQTPLRATRLSLQMKTGVWQ